MRHATYAARLEKLRAPVQTLGGMSTDPRPMPSLVMVPGLARRLGTQSLLPPPDRYPLAGIRSADECSEGGNNSRRIPNRRHRLVPAIGRLAWAPRADFQHEPQKHTFLHAVANLIRYSAGAAECHSPACWQVKAKLYVGGVSRALGDLAAMRQDARMENSDPRQGNEPSQTGIRSKLEVMDAVVHIVRVVESSQTGEGLQISIFFVRNRTVEANSLQDGAAPRTIKA
ncbi:hypothetical protein AXG93_4794s1070 [Marchantia polymorpha subsp. ruderalis]|uniref:Uncharacterized protein n=1 Tax=Marchantia polymorpha subsp. ruderalis TaxID=1480154 RepID=A0A176VHU5_MARPO|nr:hypothetical protein AXG93_4794s1070 [Marchantia polymorpha subsp. ruderalis]